MPDLTYRAFSQTATNALSTGLDALANATNSGASSTIDNSTNLDVLMDVELVLGAQGAARSTGARVLIYARYALDGTNFADLHANISSPVAVITLDAATTARRETKTGIQINPGLFQLWLRNETGQAFAATGNLLRYRTYAYKST